MRARPRSPLVGALLALLIPALPFILLGLVIWSYMRTRPATA